MRWARSIVQGMRRPNCLGMTLAQGSVSWALETDSGRPIMHKLFLYERFCRSTNLSQMSLLEVDMRASKAELAVISSSNEKILCDRDPLNLCLELNVKLLESPLHRSIHYSC